jgi:glutathione synthase/RimK-type ligase-like ATP-grasp enzyme
MMPHLWGIYREQQHSPGREFDDAEILRLVAKHVEAAGYQVHLKTPEQLGVVDPCLKPAGTGDPSTGLRPDPLPSLVFLMCERVETLRSLEPIEMQAIPHVNPLQAVLNTYRDRMIPLLAASAIPIPRSQVISSNSFNSDHPSAQLPTGSFPIWVKRADVHNTQSGDVELVSSSEDLRRVLAALYGRGISHVVLQQHIPGDLIKFYGIGKSLTGHRKDTWFKWFYHRDQDLARYPFSEEALQTVTQQAASTIGLEVYGGDAIITPTGEFFLIDINAWPSFALFREEAAPQIATWLLRRLRQGALL